MQRLIQESAFYHTGKPCDPVKIRALRELKRPLSPIETTFSAFPDKFVYPTYTWYKTGDLDWVARKVSNDYPLLTGEEHGDYLYDLIFKNQTVSKFTYSLIPTYSPSVQYAVVLLLYTNQNWADELIARGYARYDRLLCVGYRQEALLKLGANPKAMFRVSPLFASKSVEGQMHLLRHGAPPLVFDANGSYLYKVLMEHKNGGKIVRFLARNMSLEHIRISLPNHLYVKVKDMKAYKQLMLIACYKDLATVLQTIIHNYVFPPPPDTAPSRKKQKRLASG